MRLVGSCRHHKNVVADACFTRDERQLATVSWDKNIAFYDISTGMYRSEGPTIAERAHDGCISCCHFSGDGQSSLPRRPVSCQSLV